MDIKYDRLYILVMKKIAAAKFKEECLSLLDRLGPEGIIVTKHGKPVAKVLPFQQASADLVGVLRERITIKGDITSTGERWNAGD